VRTLKKVQLLASVRHVDDHRFEVFEGCAWLSKVDWLGDGPAEIDRRCLRVCGLTTVVVPRGVRELDTGGFEGRACLRSVACGGDGATRVSAGVFKDCKGLREVAVRVG
jgi:hypothetical protein